MNYFFGINTSLFFSEIQIPTFQNRKPNSENIHLFKGFPENNKWNIQEIKKNKIHKDFFLIEKDEISNSDIYFLAYKNNFYDYDYLKLINFNKFTDTSPAFRANLKIFMKNGGFSSYQSEYPYLMTTKKGAILSPVSSIANSDAEKNFIFIRNVYEKPICENFNVYLLNIKRRKIEEEFEIKTNYTNLIELKKTLIKPEIFLTSKNYLGIPIYVSIKNKHVSFEHTHPPHEYILSQNKFEKVAELKKEINEIIN